MLEARSYDGRCHSLTTSSTVVSVSPTSASSSALVTSETACGVVEGERAGGEAGGEAHSAIARFTQVEVTTMPTFS